MSLDRASLEKSASKLLVTFGVQAIWDAHLTATAAYMMGKSELAATLIEIAEAAERLWLARAGAEGGFSLNRKSG
jgi:hypothetical protein